MSACLPAPAPVTGETGIACGADTDCDAAETCVTDADGFTGGYCSRQCGSDAECPMGSHCGDNGFCMDECAVDADCRTGYLCFDSDANGSNECWPAATGTGVVGDTCASITDCAGGADGFCIDESQGFTDGYCSVQCTDDAACGAGNHCSQQFGVCLDGCAADTDCRAGFVCGDGDGDAINECFPGSNGPGVTGDVCAADADCSGGVGAFCITDDQGFTDGYCSDQCTDDTDCAAGSHCSQQFGFCLDDCASDAECRTGYACGDADGDASSECFRGANGPGAPGDACASITDCAGGVNAFCADDSQGFPGGYCIEDCTNSMTCPGDAQCVNLSDDGSFFGCVDSCSTNTDCRSGYACQQGVCWIAP